VVDDGLLQRIDDELAKLHLYRRISVTAETHDNGHPKSHIKIKGTVSTFHQRQIVDQTVLRMLPEGVHLLSEVLVKAS